MQQTCMLPALLASLGTLVELKTGVVPEGRDGILLGAEQLGLETGGLKRVLGLKRGQERPEPEAMRGIYGEILRAIQAAAGLADRL